MFYWYDYVMAVIWFGTNFLFFFRSKLYWNLGKKPGCELTQQSAFGAGFRKLKQIYGDTVIYIFVLHRYL